MYVISTHLTGPENVISTHLTGLKSVISTRYTGPEIRHLHSPMQFLGPAENGT